MKVIFCESVKYGTNQIFMDDEDYEVLSQLNWRVTTLGKGKVLYAVTKHHYKHWFMHRLITNANVGEIIDHEDGNGLNNCRYNLRKCTNSQNLSNKGKLSNNTTGFKGVRKHHKTGKFEASIQSEGVRRYLGSNFNNALDAAKAYNKAAIEIHGKFARLNDIFQS